MALVVFFCVYGLQRDDLIRTLHEIQVPLLSGNVIAACLCYTSIRKVFTFMDMVILCVLLLLLHEQDDLASIFAVPAILWYPRDAVRHGGAMLRAVT